MATELTPDEAQLAHDAIVSALDEMGHRKACDWFVVNQALLMLERKGASGVAGKWAPDGTGYRRIP